jgi:hypothetical protein
MLWGMSIIDSGKEILKLAEAYRNTELYEKIVTLQADIVTMSGEKVVINEHLLQAKAKIKELEEALSFKGRMILGHNSYWMEDGDGPFCVRCWEVDRRPIHLLSIRPLTTKTCPQCKTVAQSAGRK